MAIRFFNKIFSLKGENNTPFTAVSMFGICITTVFAMYLSLFMNIGLIVFVLMTLLGIIYFAADKAFFFAAINGFINEFKEMNPFSRLLFIILFILVLMETSLYIPKNYDTALYHAQAIRWIENYPAVPGLGNFYLHLAYNSSWFLASSLFSFSFLRIKSFHVLNGYVFLLGIFYFLRVLGPLFKKEMKISSLLSIFLLPIFVYLYTNFLSSPETDMPTSLLIWLIFILAVKKTEEGISDQFDIISIAVAVLSSFLITLKLSSAPIYIISLFIIIKEFFSGKKGNAIITALLSFFIVLPWLIRNVILSGYLIYPFPALDLFHFDWKMPPELLDFEKKNVELWSFKIPAGMTVLHYIPLWFINLKAIYKIIIWPLTGLFVLSLPVYLLNITKNIKHIYSKNKRYLPLFITGYAGVIFLFLTAPDVRYGAGFMVIFCLLHFSPVFKMIFSRVHFFKMIMKIYCLSLSVFIILFEGILFSRYFYNSGNNKLYGKDQVSNIKERLLLPADYRKDAMDYKEFIFNNNIKVYSHGDINWYEPFPSTQLIQNGLELRGKSLAEGFRIRR